MRQFHSDFYRFFDFLDRILFSQSIKFILGLVFCLNQIFISRLWFFVHMRQFDMDFLFSFKFVNWFF